MLGPALRRILPRFLPALAVVVAGCGPGDAPVVEEGGEPVGAGPTFRYLREYVFVGARADTPLVAPFAFRAAVVGDSLRREARAWLARGDTWDQFLDESFSTAPSSGVWRVLPTGALSLSAAGPNEVDALWYREGPRRLRLDVGAPLTEWTPGDEVRYRVDRARLTLGPEAIGGLALEVLRVERSDEEGGASDVLLLASGDSLRLLLAETLGPEGEGRGVGWLGAPGGDRVLDAVEVRWLEVAPYEEARRDIPMRWTFRVPPTELRGQVASLGYSVVLGEEQAGRRPIEVRYTVAGWVERDGVRSPVTGVLRHHQR